MQSRIFKTTAFITMAFLLALFSPSHAATLKPERAVDSGNTMISSLLLMNDEEIARLTGKRLNFFQKGEMVLLKRRIRKTIRKQGDMTLREFMASVQKRKSIIGRLLVMLGAIVLLAVFLTVSLSA